MISQSMQQSLGGQFVSDERKAFDGVFDDDLPPSEIHVIGDSK